MHLKKEMIANLCKHRVELTFLDILLTFAFILLWAALLLISHVKPKEDIKVVLCIFAHFCIEFKID